MSVFFVLKWPADGGMVRKSPLSGEVNCRKPGCFLIRAALQRPDGGFRQGEEGGFCEERPFPDFSRESSGEKEGRRCASRGINRRQGTIVK